jgi:hypothetical protein
MYQERRYLSYRSLLNEKELLRLSKKTYEVVLSKEGASVALTGQNVDDTSRVAGLPDELSEPEGGQRGLLGGLQDAHAASGQHGGELPGGHQQREVPGD